jgi:YesN/AraC family two-component response regulator
MPEMTGEQLASAIKNISPQTPMILLTGFGESRNGNGHHPAIDHVLSKPVSSIDLRQATVRLLA